MAPILVLPHPQISQSRGKDTIIDCITTSNPLGRFVWVKDGSDVLESDRYTLQRTHVHGYTYRLELYITGLIEEDFGTFFCVSENAIGASEESMVLYG